MQAGTWRKSLVEKLRLSPLEKFSLVLCSNIINTNCVHETKQKRQIIYSFISITFY